MTMCATKHIPNIITFTRLAFTPLLVYFILQGVYMGAVIVFTVICLTDIFDGLTARMLGACTRVGAILDVITDLFYIVSSLVVLNIMHMAPFWLTLLVLFKFAEFYGTSYILRKCSTESVFVSDLPGRICAALLYMIPGVICLFQRIKFYGSGLVVTTLLVLIIFTALTSTCLRWFKCMKMERKHLL